MSKKILILQGHPDTNSYCDALAEAYQQQASANQHQTKMLRLSDLQFDPNVHPHDIGTPLEEDIQQAQTLIGWADHLVLIYPIWWGGMPALVKGFIDKTLAQHFAFEYQKYGFPIPLLKHKTIHIINTTDTPAFIQWFVLRADKIQQKSNIWGLCGVKVLKHQRYGSMVSSTEAQRSKWLEHLKTLVPKA